jgi:hypothetical protein
VCQAIADRRLLRFAYNGRTRLVVPCAHGVLDTGNEALRAHEVAAPRLGKLFLLRSMVAAEVCAEGFDAPPTGYRRGDTAMARIHCQL